MKAGLVVAVVVALLVLGLVVWIIARTGKNKEAQSKFATSLHGLMSSAMGSAVGGGLDGPGLVGGALLRRSPQSPAWLHPAGTADHVQALMDAGQPCVVMVSRDACEFCRKFRPMFETVAETLGPVLEVHFFILTEQECVRSIGGRPDFHTRFKITTIPCAFCTSTGAKYAAAFDPAALAAWVRLQMGKT
jgi:hypothetical protein